MSAGPDVLASLKRFSTKEPSIQPRLDEEVAAIAETPGGQVTVESSLPVLSSSSSIPVHSIPCPSPSTDVAQVISATNGVTDSVMTSVHGTGDSTVAAALPGHVMGRNFDEDSDDDIHIGEELVQLSGLFERASQVLNSPVRCGVFLNYLFVHNRDTVPALFYLVAQHFQYVLRSSKDMLKEQRRLSMEIFTTFLHEKSPLRLDIPTPVVHKTSEMIQAGTGSMTFNAAAEAALSLVQAQVSKLAQEIRHGMVTWKPPEPVNLFIKRSHEEELVVFELCLTARLHSLWQNATGSAAGVSSFDAATADVGTTTATTTQDQTALALCLSLATAYRYLSARLGSGNGSTSVQGSTESGELAGGGGGVGYSIRNSLFARSIENLTASALGSGSGLGNNTGSIGGSLSMAGSNIWIKAGHFGAKLKQKQHGGHLFGSRKVKHSQKSHNLHERAFERVADCWVCGQLLWGLAPQGLACNNCNLTVHTKCKSGIRETCTKEGRKSSLIASTQPGAQFNNNGCILTPTVTSTLTETTSPLASSAPITRVQSTLVTPAPNEMLATASSANHSILSPGADWSSSDVTGAPRGSIDSVSLQSLQLPPAGSLVAESSPILHPSSDYDSSIVETERTRNKSVGDEQMLLDGTGSDRRYVGRMRSHFENLDQVNKPTTPPSRSDSLASTSSVPPGFMVGLDRAGDPGTPSATSAANDLVPELVTTDWSDDPEMMAGESFEAAVELQRHFPNYQMPVKGHKSEDYIRTLCLLEFHQKTQYMVRYLKQYDYLLLRRWPRKHESLARELCLDRIPELIRLFRSLVECIDKTKTPQGYLGMAEAVYAWLTDNSCANLKTWAQHCQALSCSNMLDCVRITVRDYERRNPDIIPLLKTRHNKFVLIEGLKQMRILYFNLPLISNNIVKDLEKKTRSYKAEAKIWQQIHAKLVSLPQTIDDVCMPLVKRINSGQLYSNLDKKDAIFRQNHSTIEPFQNLLLNFPRVLFHYWVVAHAEVTVDKVTVTSANKVNHDYIRERTDMLAIMLHNALMLLVKDNDRYILRAFKATREHGSGGGGGSAPLAPPGGTPAVAGSTPDSLRSGAVGPGTQTPGPADRGPFHLSSSSFTHGTNSNVPSPTPSAVGSLSASTGSALYGSLFSGGVGGAVSGANTGGVNSSVGPSLSSPQSSAGPAGLVGAAASIASASGLSEKSSGSGSLKLAPIFPLRNVFPSCGEKSGSDHLLNIVSMDPTVLVRVLFSKEEQRKQWHDLLRENSVITPNRMTSLQQQQQQRGRLAQGRAKPGMTTISSTGSLGLQPAVSKPSITSVRPGSGTQTATARGGASDAHLMAVTSSKSTEPSDSGLFISPSSVDTGPDETGLIRGSGRLEADTSGLDASDSAGSTDDLMSPVDRLHLTINRFNRLIEQIRPVLSEAGYANPQQYSENPCQEEKEEPQTEESKARNLNDLVVLQFDLIREWLGYLSPVVARTCRRRLRGANLIPQESDPVDEESEQKLGTLSSSSSSSLTRLRRLRRSGSLTKKRQSSLSGTDGSIELELAGGNGNHAVDDSVGKSATPPPPAISTETATTTAFVPRDGRNSATLTSSTPNLFQTEHPAAAVAAVTGHIRPGAVRVQDSRHSKRIRPTRSASISQSTSHHLLHRGQQQAQSERAFVDRVEQLASKLIQVLQEYKRLAPVEPKGEDHGALVDPHNTRTLQLPMGSTLSQEYYSDDDRHSSRLLTPLDMELTTRSYFDAGSVSDYAGSAEATGERLASEADSDNHEDAFLRNDVNESGEELRQTDATDDANVSGSCHAVVSSPTEPSEKPNGTDNDEHDGGDIDDINASVEEEPLTEQAVPDPSTGTILFDSGGIRDSGCMPSITDNEGDEEDDEETLGDPLEIHRRSSTPMLDTEADLTPTALASMTDQLFDQLNDPEGPLETSTAKSKESPDETGAAPTQSELQQPEETPDPAPTEHLDTLIVQTTSVGRTDSQKSTTSSGFVESGDD